MKNWKLRIKEGDYNLSGIADSHPCLGNEAYIGYTSALVKYTLKDDILIYETRNTIYICPLKYIAEVDDIDVFGDENLRKMVLSYVDYKEKELDKRIPWESFVKELKESLKDTDMTVEWNDEKVYLNKGELTIVIEKKTYKS